ncbi:hypothetical protein NE237_029289 [Protea cynaroides]|uniref:Uncharacterized protein n=1 Tax=Protea cynaroides TaxID=273540 RepID=A0A9Q0JUY6_9MAGN|nr:hypothetical protein NE237_029289 [Protea cynaroides]
MTEFLLIIGQHMSVQGAFAEEDIGRQGIAVPSALGNATRSRGLEVAVMNLQDYCNEVPYVDLFRLGVEGYGKFSVEVIDQVSDYLELLEFSSKNRYGKFSVEVIDQVSDYLELLELAYGAPSIHVLGKDGPFYNTQKEPHSVKNDKTADTFSSMPTFGIIMKNGSTEEFSWLLYICGLLRFLIRLWYGIPIVSPAIILVAMVNSIREVF